jgi:hypothetical protein
MMGSGFGFYGYYYPEAALNNQWSASNTNSDFNCNKMRDRFYFSFPIFYTFLLIRILIIKEPYLFLLMHFLFSIFYLNDQHLFYTYIYAFTVTNKSVFIFF